MRLLIVDESFQAGARISALLESALADCEVVTAGDPLTYMQALRAEPADVVLTEDALPWTDGLAVLHDVQARWPGVPVIMVSAPGNERLVIQGFRAGLDDCVTKDRLDELVPAVRALLGSPPDEPGSAPDELGSSHDQAPTRRTLRAALGTLRENEERYHALVTASSYVIYRMSPDWREMRELNGHGFLEDIDAPSDTWVEAYILPEDRSEVLSAVEEAIRTKHVFELEHRVRSADGTVGWAYSRAVPLHNGRGDIVEWVGAASDITARKRAEEALRESEARYRTLFESIDEGFCVIEVLFDPDDEPVDYRFLQVNPSFEAQTGIEHGVGRRMREIAPDHEAHWFEIYGRVARTGEPIRFQNPAQALGRYYDVYAFRIGEPDQRRVGVLFKDITERRQNEAALQESEEKFRRIVETANEGIWMVDAEFRTTYVNQRMVAMLGTTPDEMYARSWRDFVAPEAVAISERHGERRRQGERASYEHRLLRTDGAVLWVIINATPIYDADGRFAGSLSMVTDITEQKQLEERLRASEERFRAVQENSLDRFTILKPFYDDRGEIVDFTYIYQNARAATTAGYQPEELVGRRMTDVFPTFPETHFFAVYKSVVETEKTTQFEDLYHADGVDDWFCATVTPIPGGIAVATEIITERKRAEADLRRYATELETLNAQNRVLLREVDHRVKNNLMAILSLITEEQMRLDSDLADGSAKAQSLAALDGLSERVLSLATAHKLLSESGWRPLDIRYLVHQVIGASVSAGSTPAERPTVEIRGDDVRIAAQHAHNLALVIGELVTNTLKYASGTDALRISVEVTAEDGKVRLCYRDNGPGYPASTLAGGAWSVGLDLIDSVITQSLGGSWRLYNQGGAATELCFPADLGPDGEVSDG